MALATIVEGSPFDDLPPFENALTANEEDISGCAIVQALAVALVVVADNEIAGGGFKFAGQEASFEQDQFFHRAVVALDLSLRDGMATGAPEFGSTIKARIRALTPIRVHASAIPILISTQF